jgi:hypothetical protein
MRVKIDKYHTLGMDDEIVENELVAVEAGTYTDAVPVESFVEGAFTILNKGANGVVPTGSITVEDGGTDTDSVTVGGITVNIDTSSPVAPDIDAEATAAELAASLLAALTGDAGYATEDWTIALDETDPTVLNITGKTPGVFPVLTESGTTFTVSGTGTLEGPRKDAFQACWIEGRVHPDAGWVVIAEEATNADFTTPKAPVIWSRDESGAAAGPDGLADTEYVTVFMNLSGFTHIRFLVRTAANESTHALILGELN